MLDKVNNCIPFWQPPRLLLRRQGQNRPDVEIESAWQGANNCTHTLNGLGVFAVGQVATPFSPSRASRSFERSRPSAVLTL
jgi:hypothetical protein